MPVPGGADPCLGLWWGCQMAKAGSPWQRGLSIRWPCSQRGAGRGQGLAVPFKATPRWPEDALPGSSSAGPQRLQQRALGTRPLPGGEVLCRERRGPPHPCQLKPRPYQPMWDCSRGSARVRVHNSVLIPVLTYGKNHPVMTMEGQRPPEAEEVT